MSSLVTEYALKRCKQIGYFKTPEMLLNIVQENNLKNVLYITDDYDKNVLLNNPEVTFSSEIESINNLNPEVEQTIIIELAHETTTTVNYPVELEDINNVILDTIIKDYPNSSDRLIKKFSKFITNYKFFEGKKLDKEILDAIKYCYENIHDTGFQENMLSILEAHNIDVETLPATIEKEINIYPHTKMFEDIKIATDSKAKYANNKKFNRKASDFQDQAKVNNLIQLQAFTSNMFVVMHGKKNTGISNVSHLQNHDIISTLWRNGVHTTPISTYDRPKYSFDKLVESLHKLKSFNIYFIHPNLEIPGSISECPSDDIQPSYAIGFGEILAISYRYIVLNFFPYCSVHADDMEQIGFII